MTDHIHLVMIGKPSGKGRPRFVKATGRTYTDEQTMSAEQRVVTEWMMAGQPRIDGPVHVQIVLEVARPKSHYRANGSLSAAGRRALVPVRKPDLDNAAKLVMDALNGRAYRDDVEVVSLSVCRCWSPDDMEFTSVTVAAFDADVNEPDGVRAVTPLVRRDAA
jgi:Holliday junction resolvase RusA-like endonuclease